MEYVFKYVKRCQKYVFLVCLRKDKIFPEIYKKIYKSYAFSPKKVLFQLEAKL